MAYDASVGLKVAHMALVNDTEPNPEETVIIPQKPMHDKPLFRSQSFRLKPVVAKSRQKITKDITPDDSIDLDRCLTEDDGEQNQIKPGIDTIMQSTDNDHLTSHSMTERTLQLPEESLVLTQELDVSSHQHMRLLPSKILEMNIKRENFLNRFENQVDETYCECDFGAKEGKMVVPSGTKDIFQASLT